MEHGGERYVENDIAEEEVRLAAADRAAIQARCAAEVEQGVVGEYRRIHTISYFDGRTAHQLEQTDTLKVSAARDGQFRFSIETVADNGHTCNMDGVASSVEDYFEFREVVDLDPSLTGGKSLECVLKLEVGDQQIDVLIAQYRDRIGPVAGFDDLEAGVPQDHHDTRPQILFVIDDENSSHGGNYRRRIDRRSSICVCKRIKMA